MGLHFTKLATLFLILSTVSHAASLEEMDDGRKWDLSLSTGLKFGTVTLGASTTPKNYGGFPIAAVLNEPIFKNFLLSVSFQIVVDLGNFQASSQGLDLGFQYILMGGARRRVKDFGEMKLLGENPYDLSLLVRGGLHGYTAVSRVNVNDTLTGTVYETMGGISYRQDINSKTAFYVQAMITLFNMPASSERINPSLFELNFGYRFYL